MGIERIGHLYAETTSWESSVGFWEALGFSFVERWGSDGHRAGRLTNAGAVVVLAEVAEDPGCNIFFDASDLDAMVPLDGVITPLGDTHWGTRWIRVTDPDGRVLALEESP